MRYMGGKTRIAKYIAPIVLEAGGPIWEPFCGGLSVTVALGGKHIASDANPALISLYQAIQRDGWKLDHYEQNGMTKDEWIVARELPDSDPLKAFAGFGCSFGGVWFGGFARGAGRDFAQEAARNLKKQFTNLQQTQFSCELFGKRDFRGTIYCDPPYRNTATYKGAPKFDHDKFVADVERYKNNGCTVFVSEQEFDGSVVWEKPLTRTLNKSSKVAMERLYRA